MDGRPRARKRWRSRALNVSSLPLSTRPKECRKGALLRACGIDVVVGVLEEDAPKDLGPYLFT